MISGLISVFSAIKLRWRGILIICLFLGIALLVWQWRTDIQEAQRLRSENDQLVSAVEKQRDELNELIEENNRRKRINEKHKNRIKNLKSKLRKTSYGIEDKIQNNEKVADWSDTDMPDVVYNSLWGKRTVEITEIKPILPPKQWIEEIQHPQLMGKKNEHLWLYALEQEIVLDLYRIRLEKLRQWRNENKKNKQGD